MEEVGVKEQGVKGVWIPQSPSCRGGVGVRWIGQKSVATAVKFTFVFEFLENAPQQVTFSIQQMRSTIEAFKEPSYASNKYLKLLMSS